MPRADVPPRLVADAMLSLRYTTTIRHVTIQPCSRQHHICQLVTLILTNQQMLQSRIYTMTDPDLVAKQAYFHELKLLDTSDDEGSNGDVFDRIESVMAEMQDPKPPRLARQTSSFLGPTPKEVKDDFEAHTARRRAVTRNETRTISRSVAAPEVDLTQSFPVTKPRARQLSIAEGESNSKMKRVASLPNMTGLDQTPFYKQMGVVPRELKNGKNVKPADNIKLLPESHQLLRGKIIYFYPNDDVSMVRRTRIHKVIQLGAAWVNKWRDDVTHVLVDDVNHTYTQLLRHLNRAGFSVC